MICQGHEPRPKGKYVRFCCLLKFSHTLGRSQSPKKQMPFWMLWDVISRYVAGWDMEMRDVNEMILIWLWDMLIRWYWYDTDMLMRWYWYDTDMVMRYVNEMILIW